MKENSLELKNIENLESNKDILWEDKIRILTRIASLLVLGLILIEYSSYKNILSPILIEMLLIVFLVGLNLTFFQLRWINEKRNKSTNLGGIIGLFGLFLTLIISILSIFFQSISFLTLFIFGLSLAIIGFFVEITRIDEPLVYWFKENMAFITRVSIFLMTLVLSGLGLVLWESTFELALILFLTGYFLGIAVWYNHRYFRRIGTTLSIVVFLIGMFLNYHSSNTTGFREIIVSISFIFMNSLVNIVFWRVELINLFVGIKNAIIQTVHFTVRFIKDTMHSVYLAVISFFYYVWIHRIGIFRASVTIISPLIMLGAFILPIPKFNAEIFVRGMIFIVGLAFLYITWFNQVNNFTIESFTRIWNTLLRVFHTTYNFLVAAKNTIIQAVHSTVRFINDAIHSVYLAIISFFYYIWDHRIDIFRASVTIISPLIMLGAFILPIPKFNAEIFVRGMIFIVGLAFLYITWFSQVNDFIKKTSVAIKDTFIKTVRAIHNFLAAAKNTIIQAVHSTVRFIKDTIHTVYLAVISFFYYIWAHRVQILRGCTTILGFFLVIVAVFLSLLEPSTKKQLANGLLFLIGISIIYATWLYKVNNFIKQSLLNLWDISKRTYQLIVKLFVSIKNAIINGVHTTILFIRNTLHSIWDHRLDILRGFMTIIGPVIIFFALSMPSLTTPLNRIEFWIRLGLFICGIGLLYSAWFYQVNSFVKRSLFALRNAVIQVYGWIVKAITNVITQLRRLFSTAIDLIIPIILLILSVTATSYGLFVLIYAITPIGPDIDQFLISNIPFLNSIVRIIQFGSYKGTLIGWFSSLPGIVQIMLGIGIITFGVIVFLLVVIKRETMKLQSIFKGKDLEPESSARKDATFINYGKGAEG